MTEKKLNKINDSAKVWIPVIEAGDYYTSLFSDLYGDRYRFLHCAVIPDIPAAMQKNPLRVLILVQNAGVNNAMDALKSLKRRYPSTPVIFLAQIPSTQLILTAFRYGAREVIAEPVDIPYLSESIEKLIGFGATGGGSKAKTNILKKIASIFVSHFVNPVKSGIAKSPPAVTHSPLPAELESGQDTLREVPVLNTVPVNNDLGRIAPHPENAVPLPGEMDSAQHAGFSDGSNGRSAGNDRMLLTKEEKFIGPKIDVLFLGPFRVIINGASVENWPSKKGKSIFSYLAFHHKRKIYRDLLMEKFWPNSTADSARNCLNVTLHGLRNVLKELDEKNEYILFKDECYYLNPGLTFQSDVDIFKEKWHMAQADERANGMVSALPFYETAAACYYGEFMEEEIYEEWVEPERENLKEIYLFILDRISHCYSQNGKPDIAIGLCDKILEKDNCREDIHRRLMVCYFRLGQRDKAVRQFQKCETILHRVLEISPAEKTVRLYKQIKNAFP